MAKTIRNSKREPNKRDLLKTSGKVEERNSFKRKGKRVDWEYLGGTEWCGYSLLLQFR